MFSYFTDATALLNNHRLCESERHYGGNLKYFPYPVISLTQWRFSFGLGKTLRSGDPHFERKVALRDGACAVWKANDVGLGYLVRLLRDT